MEFGSSYDVQIGTNQTITGSFLNSTGLGEIKIFKNSTQIFYESIEYSTSGVYPPPNSGNITFNMNATDNIEVYFYTRASMNSSDTPGIMTVLGSVEVQSATLTSGVGSITNLPLTQTFSTTGTI